MKKDTQIKTEIIEKLWSIIKNKIYSSAARNDTKSAGVKKICLSILGMLYIYVFSLSKSSFYIYIGYVHSAEYLSLYKREAKELNENGWNLVQNIKNDQTWTDALKEDIESTEQESFFNNIALDHGWDNLNFYSNDFDERNMLLEQWYDLESKSNNPIGMAAILRRNDATTVKGGNF